MKIFSVGKLVVIEELILVRSDDIIVIVLNGKFVTSGYSTCANCRAVSAVVSLSKSFLFLSISCSVLVSGKQSGFEK